MNRVNDVLTDVPLEARYIVRFDPWLARLLYTLCDNPNGF